MTDKTYNVLFPRTGNSARSVLAKFILNMEGDGRFKAYSTGRQPKGEVNPLLKNRISAFIDLPVASIDRFAFEQHGRQIGSLDGASVKSAKAE